MKTVSLISSAVVAALLASEAVADESNSVVLAKGELQHSSIQLRQDYGDEYGRYGDEEEEEGEPAEPEEETEDDAAEEGEEESEAFDPLLPGGEIWGYINLAQGALTGFWGPYSQRARDYDCFSESYNLASEILNWTTVWY
jgi:hypothetical protein